jgi:hypothetical protein
MNIDGPNLFGAWNLVKIQIETEQGAERVDLYGANPIGRLILCESGHMMALVTAAGRCDTKDQSDSAELFGSMMAYSGSYRLEGGDKFITTVDVAWHPAWNGTEQTRFYKLDGDNLSIRTARQTHPKFLGQSVYGVVVWRRERK